MNSLNNKEMYQVRGGASLTSSMLNALMRAVTGMFEIGQAVGSAIRRIAGKNYC